MLHKIYEILSTLDEKQITIVYSFLLGLRGGDAHGNQGK